MKEKYMFLGTPLRHNSINVKWLRIIFPLLLVYHENYISGNTHCDVECTRRRGRGRGEG